MRSSLEEIRTRRERLAELLRREGYLSVGELASRFHISEATVRRDLRVLEKDHKVTRTHGGALFEYDELFLPFYQRHMLRQDVKRSIARAVLPLVGEAGVIFLDAGSTVFCLAQMLVETGMEGHTFVTNSLPVAEAVMDLPRSEVHLLAGCLLPHQLVLLGPGTDLSLVPWNFHLAVMGVEAMDSDGLWNSREQIVEFQRHVCARSRRVVFCADSSKIGRRGPSFLLPWRLVDMVATDADPKQLERLGPEAGGVRWLRS